MGTQGLQKVVKTFGETLSKNSPTILTGLSVAGLLSTTILAVKATPKALTMIEDEQYRRQKEGEDPVLTAKEIVVKTWKCYIPAAIMSAATIACIIGANSINQRRNAALASLYTFSEKALKEYKAKVAETIGETKAREIKESISRDKVARTTVDENDALNTGHGNTLCYDALSGRYFISDVEYIRKVITDLSRKMITEDYITLNEVYYALDLRGTKIGDMVGWHVDDGRLEPHFSSQLTENDVPCFVLDFDENPRPVTID